jgi:hypothetical protein
MAVTQVQTQVSTKGRKENKMAGSREVANSQIHVNHYQLRASSNAITCRGAQDWVTKVTKPRHSPLKIPRPRSDPLPLAHTPQRLPARAASCSDAPARSPACPGWNKRPLSPAASARRQPQSLVKPPDAKLHRLTLVVDRGLQHRVSGAMDRVARFGRIDPGAELLILQLTT